MAFSVYAADAILVFGLENQFHTESIKLEKGSSLSLYAPSIGAYVSSCGVNEGNSLGVGISATFRDYYMADTLYSGVRVLFGASMFPFQKTLPISAIAGIILQPEWESSSNKDTTSFLFGLGTDIQICSKINSAGLGISLNLSAYPFFVTSNKSVKIDKYNRFSIGFTIGCGVHSSVKG